MAQKIINTKIQEAYDTEANWIKYNPVLLAGQLAFSKDKYGKYKIGDGIAKWSQLQYMTLGWNDITGKPSSFVPSSHTHTFDQITNLAQASVTYAVSAGSAGTVPWGGISGKPTSMKNPYALTISNFNNTKNVEYDGSSAQKVNLTADLLYGATDGAIASATEYGGTGTRYVKLLDVTCNSAWQRTNQQFLISTRNSSCLLDIHVASADTAKFSQYNISYIPMYSNFEINKFSAGIVHVDSKDRFEFWYEQQQWTNSVNVIPLGRSKETSYGDCHFKGYNTANEVNTTKPKFTINIAIEKVLPVLYSSTGNAIDGTMTQQAITNALGTRALKEHTHTVGQISGLPTKLPNPYVLTIKGNGALLNTYDGSGAKEINITPASIGAATSGHTHSQYAPTSHNHSADNITSGVLPIGRGGTGGTSLTTAANSLQFESIGTGITNIQNNADLNTYITPGTYTSQSATNTGIKNRPSGTLGAFKLVVKYALGDNAYIQQIMTGYHDYSHMEYVRYYDKYSGDGTWSRWIKTFDDSDIIPVTNGGTGANNYKTALKNLVVNGAVSSSAVPTDTNWYLCSDNTDSNGTPVKRPMSSLWSYIKGKTDPLYQPKGSYAATSHTHNYAAVSHTHTIANITSLQSTLTNKADKNHYHKTILSFTDEQPISISTKAKVTVSEAKNYDIVVANTTPYGGNKLVTMSYVELGNHIIHTAEEQMNIQAITNSQIDSLASL